MELIKRRWATYRNQHGQVVRTQYHRDDREAVTLSDGLWRRVAVTEGVYLNLAHAMGELAALECTQSVDS